MNSNLCAALRSDAKSDQLRRVIAEGIVGRISRRTEVGFSCRRLVQLAVNIDIMCVDGDRRSGLRIHNGWDQRGKTRGPLYQDGSRSELANEPCKVPCARRAVMTDREVDTRRRCAVSQHHVQPLLQTACSGFRNLAHV